MTDRFIARTGRVQSWMDNPESRLPVSCCVINVQDSMEGPDGIEESWRFVSHALRNAAGVAVHLSELRPNGAENGKGLVASGAVSFARVYSVLNETLRRGGTYKNGACCIHIDANSPDLEEFIDATRAELPWVKKTIDITEEWWNELDSKIKQKIYAGIQSGDLWMNKVKYDSKNNRIFGNVCQEIYIPSRGTCLLEHINMGQCTPGDLKEAFVYGMTELCELHSKTGVGDTGEYLSPEEDRQVGLGMLGFANFLAQQGVTYEQFGKAVEQYTKGPWPVPESQAAYVVEELDKALAAAAAVARRYNMERAFTIAPTASCSYKYKDLNGFTTTPEIAPPISRQVDRDSGTFGVQSYDYGFVEIASEVGWENYKRVADGIVQLMTNTGLFHGYSFNTWSDMVTYDEAFIQEWLSSPQTSLYYALQVQPDTLRKDDVASLLDDDTDYADLFGFDDSDQFCSSCAE